MIATYRDPRYAASIRMEQLRAQRKDLPDDVFDTLIGVYSRRVARLAAGTTAVVGFFVMVLAAILKAMDGNRGGSLFPGPTVVLLDSVLLSVVVYVTTRVGAAVTFWQRVRASMGTSDDVLAQAARLEEGGVRRTAMELASRHERWGIAAPMAGISLLAPLTMHLVLYWLPMRAPGSDRWLASFDVWIQASLILVGIAHVTLALLCVRFGRLVAEARTSVLASKIPVGAWTALGYTILASCIPGLIAFALPVAITAVTGLVFIPPMFVFMYRRATRERQALEAA